MNVAPGATYEAVVDWGVTGLTGTLGLRLIDNAGATTVARATTSITEQPAGSGIYVRTGNVAPPAAGQYTLVWDDGSATPGHVATEDLNVTYDAPADPAPVAPTAGPLCSAWITGADVAACGPDDLGVGSDVTQLDDVAYDASYVLFDVTGRRYPGVCTATVRPCRDRCGCWDSAIGDWSWSYASGTWYAGRRSCGCGTEEEILLAGFPVLAVLEVKIDGDVVDASTYRLDGRRKLLRLDDPGPPVVKRRWPACQNITLPDTEAGTFAITYTWGGLPPSLGQMAASQLARELWKACTGGTCALPSKVTKVVRQGTTYERTAALAKLIREGSTGLPILDAFIVTAGPNGSRRRPAIWSPDRKRFPRRVG